MSNTLPIAFILATSVAGWAFSIGIGGPPGLAAAPPETETRLAAPTLVTTARPSMRVFTLRASWIGVVEPQASVKLTALVAGRIEAIEAEDQAGVEQGRPVMRLGGARAEGQRAKLSAEVQSLASRLDLARQTVGRLKEGLKARLATQDQVAAAEDAQTRLEAGLREARLDLEIFEKELCLSAPVSGTFTRRRVSVGQDVQAGEIVGEIIDPAHLRIAASVFPPRGMELLGTEATVRLEANRTLAGRVRRVVPQASSTGAVQVWIEGPQIDGELRPGQTVGGSLAVRTGPERLAVPESSIVYDAGEHPYLFVAKDGAYEARRVELGLTENGWVEVLSGLKPGEPVVAKGAYELFYRRFNEQFTPED